MKRFITYLYEYDQGRKTKNTGFIRADIRNDIVNMEVCVRNYIRTMETGKVYGLVQQEKLYGVILGDIKIRGGQSDNRLCLEKNNLANSGYSIEDIVGIAISFENDGYLASCWKEASAEGIASGNFSPYKTDVKVAENDYLLEEKITTPKRDEILVTGEKPQLQETEIEKKMSHEVDIEKFITYRKIDLNQIRERSKRNWHLCNNSFLMHGVFNYGYLILKKVVDNEKETHWLGVPGFFEKPEMLMAVFFGFTEFEPIPKAVIDMEMDTESMSYYIEKNQEPKTGIFGGWFVKLDE